jgi:hypothetical protein
VVSWSYPHFADQRLSWQVSIISRYSGRINKVGIFYFVSRDYLVGGLQTQRVDQPEISLAKEIAKVE